MEDSWNLTNKMLVDYVDCCFGETSNSWQNQKSTIDYEKAYSELSQQTKGSGDLWFNESVESACGCSTEDGPRYPSWPMGARFALALTHDVDFVTSTTPHLYFFRRLERLLLGQGPRWQGILCVLGSLYRIFTDIPRRERYGDLVDWMNLEHEKNVRSTFFFLPYGDGCLHIRDGDYRFEDTIWFDKRKVKVSEAIKTIHDAGWEIGLHGTIRSAWEPGLLLKQKRQLESIIKAPIVSVRQHYLSYDVYRTPSIQASAGFKFDSTHGFNTQWGYPSGTCHPYPLWDSIEKQILDLIELPMAMMDVSERLPQSSNNDLERLTISGMNIISQVEQHMGALVLNWHPHYWSMGLAREIYEIMLNEGIRRKAYIGPLREVGEQRIIKRSNCNQ